MSELEKRVNDLEIKFSYQEDLVNELNLIVANQQNKIDEMLKALRSLNEQASQKSSGGSSSSDDKPPHY